MSKLYDQEYFDRWYRGRHRVHTHAEVRRKIMMAVTIAEYFLRRPIERVLDIGAGEGNWFTHLRSLRRRASYLGIEPSHYAIERFGTERNLLEGSFADLGRLRLRGPYDLVVCSDVLHYLTKRDIAKGIGEVARLTGGVAYIEVLTTEDTIIGDLEGLMQRPADWYRRQFEQAGFSWVGPYCWLSPELRHEVSELERA